MRKLRARRPQEGGATLVEFALVLPLLVLLLFGIIEFGWLFARNLDVRHGAREGARLAAVNELTDVNDICSRMDTANSSETLISATRDADSIGSDIEVTVDAPASTLTGLLDWAIPSGTRLQSTVTIRVEQTATWSEFTAEPCP